MTFCFGLHSISETERHNLHYSTFVLRIRLVKTAKASPHAKFYCLSTAERYVIIIWRIMQGRNSVTMVRLKRNHSVMVVTITVRLSSWSRLTKNFVLFLIVSVKLGLSWF